MEDTYKIQLSYPIQTLWFGKYTGKRLTTLIKTRPDYVLWLIEEGGLKLTSEQAEFLKGSLIGYLKILSRFIPGLENKLKSHIVIPSAAIFPEEVTPFDPVPLYRNLKEQGYSAGKRAKEIEAEYLKIATSYRQK